MGLPLYQPRVESDLPSHKSASGRGAEYGRSTVRRLMQERVERAQRSRDSRSTRDRNHSPSLVLALEHVFGRPVRTERPPRSAVTASRDPLGLLDDDYMADESGLPWARTSSSLNRRRDLNDGSLWLTMAVEPDFLPRPQPSVERHAVSSIRSTLAPDHAPRRATRSPVRLFSSHTNIRSGPTPSSMRRSYDDDAGNVTEDLDHLLEPQERRSRPSIVRPSVSISALEATTRLDGLGDRNRSLSPEGDGVWDTLLTTLTPDPQPPSVGSSFASATASARASQSTLGTTRSSASVGTSFTRSDPDSAAEEPHAPAFDPHCESGCDNSDTEGDEEDDDDDEMDQNPFSSHILGSRTSRRPNGSGTRSSESSNNSNDDPFELVGGRSVMQRIMRNLASRGDIPDEWWAQFGLSRSLPREASENQL